MLRLDDHWVWDSWVADDGELYHLFFLKAARSEEGPGSRHARARVGHATSTDLVDWVEQPDALGPLAGGLGRPGDLDRVGRPRRRRPVADVLHRASPSAAA